MLVKIQERHKKANPARKDEQEQQPELTYPHFQELKEESDAMFKSTNNARILKGNIERGRDALLVPADLGLVERRNIGTGDLRRTHSPQHQTEKKRDPRREAENSSPRLPLQK